MKHQEVEQPDEIPNPEDPPVAKRRGRPRQCPIHGPITVSTTTGSAERSSLVPTARQQSGPPAVCGSTLGRTRSASS